MEVDLKKINEYFVVIASIILSGSVLPFAYSTGYSKYLIFLLLFLFFARIFYIKRKPRIDFKINFGIFILLLWIFLYFFAQIVIKEEYEYLSEYLGYLIRCLIAFLIVMEIGEKTFIQKFTKTIYVLAVISLIFYFGGLLFPSLIYKLPIIYDDVKTGFRFIGIYVYQGIDFWNFRNAGIFWEPGAFQVFLNITLIFNFFYFKENLNKKNAILIITVITTLSTIGFIVLASLLSVKLIQSKSKLKYIGIVFIFPLLIKFMAESSIIYDKIFMRNVSKGDRIAGQIADLLLFLQKPLFGVGYKHYLLEFKDIALNLGAVAPNSSNSYTVMLALNGLIYFIPLIVLLYIFFTSFTKSYFQKITIILSLILMLSTEGFLTKLLFVIFMFYGVKKINFGFNKKNRSEYEFKSISNNSHL